MKIKHKKKRSYLFAAINMCTLFFLLFSPIHSHNTLNKHLFVCNICLIILTSCTHISKGVVREHIDY